VQASGSNSSAGSLRDTTELVRSRLTTLLPSPLQPGAAVAGRATRHRWYDSFDWRLHRAGLHLEHLDIGAGPLLRLRTITAETEAQIVAEQPLPFTSRVRFPHELPAGPVRDALGARLWPRALLQLGEVSAAQAVLPILNGEGKPVVRLRVENARLLGRSGERLPLRVEVLPLRGYATQANKVAAALEAAFPGSAADGQLAAVLAAQGRVAGDYTGKLSVDVFPGQASAAALKSILGHLQTTIDVNVDGTIRRLDTEFLHDLRVAVRRARSAVKLLSGVLDPAAEQHLAGELRWLGSVTSPPRDLDVLHLLLEEIAPSWPAGAADDLAMFGDLLAAQADRAYSHLRRALRSDRYLELRTTILTAPATGSLAETPVERLGAKRLRRITSRVLREGNEIGAATPGEALHDLRKRCKELRYLLELLAPVFAPDRHGRVVKELKQLQETLGDFQDGEVQRDAVRSAAAELLRTRPPDDTLVRSLLAMGRLAGEMDSRQAEARTAFANRWVRFTAPGNLADLAALGGRR
jgi:CHAD domain-containing protein